MAGPDRLSGPPSLRAGQNVLHGGHQRQRPSQAGEAAHHAGAVAAVLYVIVVVLTVLFWGFIAQLGCDRPVRSDGRARVSRLVILEQYQAQVRRGKKRSDDIAMIMM